ncbi:DNA repair protein RecO [Psychroserpens ponticola]|uniref:DNA repair protein RecO n=1 Tax=Psychroserpens ponticola TaxID=2932268 RepID=A0ABY7RWH7_9FLAO|nr:DNA repair protein RecO [Psychroserpens ponticola]WCO01496.1 DNA repair protein RecO [Psychroserpens ponticola]
MLNKNKAIVISKIRYRDNDLIAKCFTQQKGLVSYVIPGALKNTKGKSKAVYFQLLSQLQIEENFKANQSLQYIKEIKIDYIYRSVHTNVYKSSIAMFLAEILSTVLKEEEQNLQLYEYLEVTFKWLDYQEEFSNFHLLFLLNLTQYLGFYPENTNIEAPYFNLSNGLFETQKTNSYSISGGNLTLLKSLLGINFDELKTIKISSKQRQSFLAMLLLYFELHLGSFKKPKSLQVFNQVFN